MGPTAATTNASSECSEGTQKKKSSGGGAIRWLLTPAIFTGGDGNKHHNQNKSKAADSAPAAAALNNRQNNNAGKKTIIETAFVNNNATAENATYRTQQQLQQQHQRALYLHGLRATDQTDFRSRSASPGGGPSFDRDVNANYGGGGRRADSACSLASTSSVADYSGRRSAPIVPYSQYYNNGRGSNGQHPQQRLLMPVGAQVKITAPSSQAVYAAIRQRQQAATAVYGNSPGPFVRGSPGRATIGCVRESSAATPTHHRLQSTTIYEEEMQQQQQQQQQQDGAKRFQPIFKRGTLLQRPADECPSPVLASPKRVSFSPTEAPSSPVYWPTKKGPSPQPPTRRRSSVAESADRPLPPVPKRSPSTSAVYGTLRGGNHQQQQQQHQQQQIRWWPPPSQSGSESGSEAGEVQRILNASSQNGRRPVGGECTYVINIASSMSRGFCLQLRKSGVIRVISLVPRHVTRRSMLYESRLDPSDGISGFTLMIFHLNL